MRGWRGFASIWGIFLALALVAPLAAQQEFTGSISGTVTDSKGGAIVGAKVTVKDTDKNVDVRSILTDEQGSYNLPLLLVGHYELTVEMAGFKKLIKSGIVLNVHDKLNFNLSLEVGAVTESVSVTTDQLMVETQTAAIAGLVSGTEVKEMPLGTRNYEELVTLMPGVISAASDQLYIGTANPFGQTNVVSYSMNGQRNSSNNWTVDGADNVDRGSNLTLLNYPSVDAIAEFKVTRSAYDAASGRAGGGQVTVITKSGTNQFHGDAYEYFRSDVLNANDFISNRAGRSRNPLRYNDFGYTFGGPVLLPHVYDGRDKTFFFFSQEIRRVINYQTLTSSQVPTQDMLQGTFTHPVCIAYASLTASTPTCTATGTQITTINPVAQEYINDIFSKLPLRTAASATALNSSYNVTLVSPYRNVYNGRQELVRFDHMLNPKHSFFVRYLHDTIPTIEPGGLFLGLALPGVATTSTNAPGYSWVARETSTFSSRMLNDAGFMFSYGAIVSDPIGLNAAANSPDVQVTLPYPVMIPRVPNLSFAGGGAAIQGYAPYRDYNRDYNVFDNFTKIIGSHTVKIGAAYHYYQKTENIAGPTPARTKAALR